ncbi:MAG: OmpA family protein, partial [Bacteroidetes bacterium]|nr:OmpA family protein [Bacteroidota bacterium]
SNRPGGKGMDDIYYFRMPDLKFVLKGKVRDEKTDEIIAGALVRLIGSDESIVEKKSEIDGSFLFDLKPSTDYTIETKHDKYLNGKGKESTKGIEEDREFERDIYMAPIEKPIELPNIMYDFGKWDLRPESMVSLDKLVETLNDNPTIVIELRSHTDFRGSAEANQELSQKRAQSVVDFLIEKGIDPARLVAKGYGESMPKTIDKKLADQFSFLNDGDVLTESFILRLVSLEQEKAHQLNRRTEFQVISTNYISTGGEYNEGTNENYEEDGGY